MNVCKNVSTKSVSSLELDIEQERCRYFLVNCRYVSIGMLFLCVSGNFVCLLSYNGHKDYKRQILDGVLVNQSQMSLYVIPPIFVVVFSFIPRALHLLPFAHSVSCSCVAPFRIFCWYNSPITENTLALSLVAHYMYIVSHSYSLTLSQLSRFI